MFCEQNANLRQATARDLVAAIRDKNLPNVILLCKALGTSINVPVDFEGAGKMTALDFAIAQKDKAIKNGPFSTAVFYQKAVKTLEDFGAHSLLGTRFQEHLEKKANEEHFHLLQ